jgi:hypothetical protein
MVHCGIAFGGSALRKSKEASEGVWDVCPVVVPVSHRARRVKVGASCCANLDAPARDAPLNRQRRPLWASGETEFHHVPSAACFQRPSRRSPAAVHRPVPRQRRQPPGHPARHGRHALRPALRRRQSSPATRRPRVPLIRAMGPFADPSSPQTGYAWAHRFNRSRDGTARRGISYVNL